MKTHLKKSSLTVLLALGGSFYALNPVHAASYYWDTNGATAGSGAATGTWDSSVSSLWSTDSTGASATSAVTTANTDALLFSAGTNGTSGTVTVSGTQVANTITVNQSGVAFSGGTIDLSTGATGTLFVNSSATIGSALKMKNVTFGAASQTLTLSGGSSSLLVGGIASGTGTNGLTSKIDLTAGTYTQGGGGGSYNIGDVSTGSGGLVVNTGVIMNAGVSFQAGTSAAGGVITLNGGTINQTGGSNSVIGRGTGSTGRMILSSGTYNSTSTGSMLVAFQNSTGVLDVNGTSALNVTGNLVLNSIGNGTTGAGGTATVNFTGSNVTTVTGINFGKATDFTGTASSGTGTLNLKGGTLYVGGNGIVKGGTSGYSANINLSGGTLAAKADWSSAMDMSLSNADGGVTVKAADAAGVGRAITLSGILSGSGPLNVSGGTSGTSLLTLQGINTYTGNTTVQTGGALTLADNAGLKFVIGLNGVNNSVTGTGTTIFDGDFTFDLTNAAATGSWTIVDNATLSETFTNNFTVIGFTNAGSNLWTLGNYTFDEATGILTAVPEPSTYALLGSGLISLWVLRRRKVKNVS